MANLTDLFNATTGHNADKDQALRLAQSRCRPDATLDEAEDDGWVVGLSKLELDPFECSEPYAIRGQVDHLAAFFKGYRMARDGDLELHDPLEGTEDDRSLLRKAWDATDEIRDRGPLVASLVGLAFSIGMVLSVLFSDLELSSPHQSARLSAETIAKLPVLEERLASSFLRGARQMPHQFAQGSFFPRSSTNQPTESEPGIFPKALSVSKRTNNAIRKSTSA